jgi:hypothetical protein
MVINTARWAAPQLARESPVMLVVDEVHRAGSSSNALALEGSGYIIARVWPHICSSARRIPGFADFLTLRAHGWT